MKYECGYMLMRGDQQCYIFHTNVLNIMGKEIKSDEKNN